MALQALFSKTCNIITNTQSLFNLRPVPLRVNLLPVSRGLKQEIVNRLKTLRIPEKPKKPPTPYFRFVSEHRPKIIKENPNFKPTEIIKKCAEDWKTVSPELKEKYNVAYKSEYEVYTEKISTFNAELSPEQKNALKDAELEKRSDRKKRKVRKVNKETNRPKRPMGPYVFFIMEQSKIRNISPKELISSLKDEWANLTDNQKAKYKDLYLKDREKYEAAMTEWEAKMVEEGREDLIRTRSPDYDKPSRIKLVKKRDPQ